MIVMLLSGCATSTTHDSCIAYKPVRNYLECPVSAIDQIDVNTTQFVARPAELRGDNTNAEVFEGTFVASADLLGMDTLDAAKFGFVEIHQAATFLDVIVEHLERRLPNNGVQLTHARVETDELAVIVAGVGIVAANAHASGDLLVTHADNPTFAGCNGFCRGQTEHFDVSKTPGWLSLVGRPESMR